MNTKRLLKLAAFLDKLPREKFNFSTIAEVPEGGKPMAVALKAGKTRCGTVGCAIGWMPAAFPRGLTWLDKWEDGLPRAFPEVALRHDSDTTDFAAAAEWFGISAREADFLFLPEGAGDDGVDSGLSGKATPRKVARHIRRFVKDPVKAMASCSVRAS